MKKRLLITALCVSLFGCGKKSTPAPTSETLQIIISNMPANTVVQLTCSIGNSSGTGIIPVLNSKESQNAAYNVNVYSGRGVNTSWNFILNSQYQGQGTFTLEINNKVIYTSSDFAGSYSFVAP